MVMQIVCEIQEQHLSSNVKLRSTRAKGKIKSNCFQEIDGRGLFNVKFETMWRMFSAIMDLCLYVRKFSSLVNYLVL